jgi:Putative addiction module component
MSPQAEQLLQLALGLPEVERIELAEALLATTMPPLDPAWLAEIQRRSEEIDRGEVTLRTWSEVKQGARERLWGRDDG